MGIIFREYEAGDVFKVKLRVDDSMGLPIGDIPGISWTIEVDGEVAACFGLHNEVGGIATLWAYGSEQIRGYGRDIIKFGKSFTDDAINVLKFQRIQAVVRADRPEYVRFIELFGFEKEGLMRKAAATGDDIYLYSRVEG